MNSKKCLRCFHGSFLSNLLEEGHRFLISLMGAIRKKSLGNPGLEERLKFNLGICPLQHLVITSVTLSNLIRTDVFDIYTNLSSNTFAPYKEENSNVKYISHRSND